MKLLLARNRRARGVPRPVRGAWVETADSTPDGKPISPRPVRGAWVETCLDDHLPANGIAAPRTGRVG